jgi:hypothetical protein
MKVVRKIFASLFVFAFAVFVSSSLVLADKDNDSSKSGRLGTVGLELKEKRMEFKEKESSKMAEVKAKVQKNLTKRLSNINRHIGAYLERLDKIASKIDSRIKKLKAKGVDTSKAEAKLADALVLGGLARSAINSANTDIGNATDKASVETAMASIRTAQKALFVYHKGLVDALRELKVANGHLEGSSSAKDGDR